MFSILSIFRNHATYERQRAVEIRRENLRWKLTILFYSLIIGGLICGTMSAWNAPSAMDVCQQTHSFDTCFQALNR